MAKKQKWMTLDEAKLSHVLATLEHTNNSIMETAGLLDCAYGTVVGILERGGVTIERKALIVRKEKA